MQVVKRPGHWSMVDDPDPAKVSCVCCIAEHPFPGDRYVNPFSSQNRQVPSEGSTQEFHFVFEFFQILNSRHWEPPRFHDDFGDRTNRGNSRSPGGESSTPITHVLGVAEDVDSHAGRDAAGHRKGKQALAVRLVDRGHLAGYRQSVDSACRRGRSQTRNRLRPKEIRRVRRLPVR